MNPKGMKLSYRFSDRPIPGIDEVGGKGQSLMRLFQAGYPVPDGIVLTTAFFEPWLQQLKSTPAWAEFLAAEATHLREACLRLQSIVETYTLPPQQDQVLAEQLDRWSHSPLLAVRSSAPAEELATASFAGAYHTILGVRPTGVAQALPVIVASSFNYRLATYLRHHHMAFENPGLAIVIQEQICSEIGGVAFSINPLSSDPTQVVFEANWGLGQTVVDGTTSPDHYVVDKVTRKLIQRRLGFKERSLVVTPDGGTCDREDHRHDQWTLDEGKIKNLTDLVIRIECEEGYPIDMEWALHSGQISILQVRPITTLIKASRETEGK